MSVKMNRISKILVTINLALGIFMWLLFSTDYSFVGLLPDLIFPPIVGLVALVSLGIVRANSNKEHRKLITLAHLPSIIGGGLYMLIGLLLIFPPFLLATLFWSAEISDEVEIQRAVSPDATRTAYVYFRPVGAYSGGNGRVFVRVKHNNIPIFERDIFSLRASYYANEETSNYLRWKDNDTIYISEVGRDYHLGVVKWQVPDVIVIVINMLITIFTIIYQILFNR